MNDTAQPEVLLGVNIDHVATIRQARGTRYPDPIQAALVAEQAGADLITLHLREDRRHIQPRDVELLCGILTTRMNLEMAATPEMGEIAARIRPADCCLVPERRAELTTEGGLDVTGPALPASGLLCPLADAGIRVSLFIDPIPGSSTPPGRWARRWWRSIPDATRTPDPRGSGPRSWSVSAAPCVSAWTSASRSMLATGSTTTTSRRWRPSRGCASSILATPSWPGHSSRAWTRRCGT
jgi:hypothetical protein